jgi:hypothetical protein
MLLVFSAAPLPSQFGSNRRTSDRKISILVMSRFASTVNRAQILLLRISITPLKIVNPSPLIKSAISKKIPLSSQSICSDNQVITITCVPGETSCHQEQVVEYHHYLHKHLTRPVKILNDDWACH